MKSVTMDNGVVLELLDEALLFDGNLLGDLQRRFSEQMVFPMLVHYWPGCKYLNLLRVQGPFEIGDISHHGFIQNPHDSKYNKEKRLFSRLILPIFTQVSFTPQEIYKQREQYMKDCNPLPNQPNVYFNISGETLAEETGIAQNGYTTIKSEGGKELSAILTGEDCRRQLEVWGIADVEAIRSML